MSNLNTHELTELFQKQEGPCLSLYQATHRSHPENAQDVIRFKNLVKDLENSLKSTYPKIETQSLLKPYYDLAENTDFWQHTLDGLVVLSNEHSFKVFHLQRPTPDFAVVSDSWHLKPLLRQLQTQDRYQVLCLSRATVALYEGNRDGLDSLIFEQAFPDTIEKALDPDQILEFNRPNAYNLGPATDPAPAMGQVHTTRKDETDAEVERFFRVVDKAVTDHVSQHSGLPLLLVCLPEHQGIFRKVSRNTHLVEQGISIDPGALTVQQLSQRAWEIMQPVAAQRVQDVVARFKKDHGTGLASDNLDLILPATLEDRVDTLLVDADQRIAGRVCRETQTIQYQPNFDAPDVEDVLDDVAEMVVRRGGKVMVVPSQYMPTQTGIAAIYRY